MFVFLVFLGMTTHTCLGVRGRKIRSLGYPGDLRIMDSPCVRGKFKSDGLVDKGAYPLRLMNSIPGTHTVKRKN